MRYIKTYENPLLEPKVGDYVICKINWQNIRSYDEIRFFLKSNIGKIIDILPIITYNNKFSVEYIIKYDKIPKDLKKDFLRRDLTLAITINQIEHWSENKEDLTIYIDANKYNL